MKWSIIMSCICLSTHSFICFDTFKYFPHNPLPTWCPGGDVLVVEGAAPLLAGQHEAALARPRGDHGPAPRPRHRPAPGVALQTLQTLVHWKVVTELWQRKWSLCVLNKFVVSISSWKMLLNGFTFVRIFDASQVVVACSNYLHNIKLNVELINDWCDPQPALQMALSAW